MKLQCGVKKRLTGGQKRVFWTAFVSGLAAFSLLAGLGAADVICRHTAFKDGETLYESSLRPALVCEKPICKITDVWYNQFVKMICPEALEDCL
ncbi:MAG: hypothetical protein LKE53_09745 [Oscillospiraceae bacterium]|jgi:hypothetical protein|nr:hypothetical protein [Oscillospiraceae bacterium]MDD3260289.1 hypothetical protein [Oscillospiraceae bacterium]